eukprot:1772002-Amphidinium_carterae.1
MAGVALQLVTTTADVLQGCSMTACLVCHSLKGQPQVPTSSHSYKCQLQATTTGVHYLRLELLALSLLIA